LSIFLQILIQTELYESRKSLKGVPKLRKPERSASNSVTRNITRQVAVRCTMQYKEVTKIILAFS